jgi:hypothetical protein
MGQLRSGGPHRKPYHVSTTIIRGDHDTPPQVSSKKKMTTLNNIYPTAFNYISSYGKINQENLLVDKPDGES